MISGLANVMFTATGFFFRLSIVVSNSTTSRAAKGSHLYLRPPMITSYLGLMNIVFIFTEVKKVASIAMATVDKAVSGAELLDDA